MKLFHVLAGLLLSLDLWGVTYCSARKFSAPDPHQATDFVERFASSQNHLSLFEAPGLVEKLFRTAPLEWKIILRKDPLLTPSLVKKSLERQLTLNAETESMEEAFLPAKLAGLDETLKGVTVTGPQELTLVLKKETEEKALRAVFASPVGIILPEGEAVTEKTIIRRGAGKFPVTVKDSRTLVFGKENLILRIFPEEGITQKQIKEEECKRLYYPPPEIRTSVKEKGGGSIIKASTTFLFVRVFHPLNKDQSLRLRAGLHPDAVPSLSKFPQSSRILSVTKPGTSSLLPLKEKLSLPTTFLTCDHVSVSPSVLKELEENITRSFRLALGVDLNWSRIDCSRIALARPTGDRLGILSAIEYRSQDELNRFLKCDHRLKLFGACGDELEIMTKGQIYPLAHLPNEFIEFY